MHGWSIEWVILVGEYHLLVGGQGSQALVPSRRREPGAHPVRVVDPVDVLDQPHPGRLEDVGRITLDEFEVPGDRPDEPTVPCNEVLPRLRVAFGGPAHKPGRIQIRDIGTGCLKASDGWLVALDGQPVESQL
jgi:hypothetical protein